MKNTKIKTSNKKPGANLYRLYETGFFAIGRKEGVPPDCLNELLDEAFHFRYKDRIWTGGCFLHGLCDVFAAALYNVFKYQTVKITDGHGKLIHAFCRAEQNGRPIYIDARGITSSYEDFISPFADFAEDESLLYHITLSDGRSKKKYAKREYRTFYENAVLFIRTNKEYYTVKKAET